jgi:hypothetical protein
MKNIHVLPTDKPSRLWINHLLQGKLELSKEVLIGSNTAQHIYITSNNDNDISDEGINHVAGSWVLNTIRNKVYKTSVNIISGDDIQKIILTTDPDLIADGVQAIDDEFLEWFVKNPSCEEVKVELHVGSLRWSDSKNTYKIIIPKEEPKQETLEEAAKRYAVIKRERKRLSNREFDFCQKDFIEGTKWQQEQDKNKYSEVFEWLANKDYLSDEVELLQKEFEQFKKK